MKKNIVFLSAVLFIFTMQGCSNNKNIHPIPAAAQSESQAVSTPVYNQNIDIRYGMPSQAGSGKVLLVRQGYVLINDTEKKDPLWVSYHLTREELENPVKRNDKFRPDPDLTAGIRAELSDYKKCGFDRGHMCPARDMARSQETMTESFYLSNMCPQAPKLNREKWEKLEEKVRNFAEKEGEIWVITGPIFKDINGKQEPDAEIGADRVWVPDAFYKIIIYNESGSAHVIAFEMKNEEETGDFTQYLRSVRDIEGQTGLDFLNVMSADEQNRLETGKAGSKEISKFLN